jgi:hypothetical protein
MNTNVLMIINEMIRKLGDYMIETCHPAVSEPVELKASKRVML